MALSPTDQLPLGLALDEAAVFDNYVLREENALAVQTLQAVGAGATSGECVFVWGESSPGLSHLLQATCHAAALRSSTALYLSLKDTADLSPLMLEGVEALGVVCLDGLEQVAGDSEWEAALFTAFNRIKEQGSSLVVTSTLTPANLPVQLPDLKSRLQSGLTFKLLPLGDEQKREVLIQRAGDRGISMSAAVADYIMLRADRGLPALMRVLDTLDAVTLQRQRQLTIPLVKDSLGW